MKTAEEIILEMGWTYDSDPARFQLWNELIKPAMEEYAQEVSKEQRRAELLKYTQWLETWVLSSPTDLVDEYLKDK